MEYKIWSTIHLRASYGSKFHQLATSSRLLIFSQKPSYQSTFAGHTAKHASDSPGELTLELPRPCKHRWHMSYPCHPSPVLADVRWGCQVHQSRCLAARARRPADASSSAAAMRRPRSGWSDLLGCGCPPVPTNGSTEIRIIQTPCRFPGKKMGVWKYGTQGTFKIPWFFQIQTLNPPFSMVLWFTAPRPKFPRPCSCSCRNTRRSKISRQEPLRSRAPGSCEAAELMAGVCHDYTDLRNKSSDTIEY